MWIPAEYLSVTNSWLPEDEIAKLKGTFTYGFKIVCSKMRLEFSGTIRWFVMTPPVQYCPQDSQVQITYLPSDVILISCAKTEASSLKIVVLRG